MYIWCFKVSKNQKRLRNGTLCIYNIRYYMCTSSARSCITGELQLKVDLSELWWKKLAGWGLPAQIIFPNSLSVYNWVHKVNCKLLCNCKLLSAINDLYNYILMLYMIRPYVYYVNNILYQKIILVDVTKNKVAIARLRTRYIRK